MLAPPLTRHGDAVPRVPSVGGGKVGDSDQIVRGCRGPTDRLRRPPQACMSTRAKPVSKP